MSTANDRIDVWVKLDVCVETEPEPKALGGVLIYGQSVTVADSEHTSAETSFGDLPGSLRKAILFHARSAFDARQRERSNAV